jgi:hypothetical protein
MAKFRKKPVVIEAVQFTDKMTMMEAPAWLFDAAMKAMGEVGRVWRDGDTLIIGTLEGDMRADLGDWIIQGVKGELYPCKPDIFNATYDVHSA